MKPRLPIPIPKIKPKKSDKKTSKPITDEYSIIVGILYHALKNKPQKQTVMGKTMTYHEGQGFFVSYSTEKKDYLAVKRVMGNYDIISIISTAVRCSSNFRKPLVIYAVIEPKNIQMSREYVVVGERWLRSRYPRLMEALDVLHENIGKEYVFIVDGEASTRPRRFVLCGIRYQLYYSRDGDASRIVYAGEQK